MLNELFLSITAEDVKAVHQFLEMGADPNGCLDEDGVTPLHSAAQLKFTPACQISTLLLAKGADPSAETIEKLKPIDVAELKQNDELVFILKTAESARS